MTLRPSDYDRNGDIIPMSWKEEKGDLISREALRNVILNDRKLDGANANWEVNRILVHIEKAPTVSDELLDYVNQSIEAEKNAMTDYHDLASEDYHKGIIYAFECMKMKLM